MLKSLRRFIGALTLTPLRRADILIFDAEGSWVLTRCVLEGLPHEILPARFERIHIQFVIVAGMFANLGRLRFVDMPSGWYCDPRMILIHIRHLYFLACLDAIKPKVVLTYIDTDFYFQRCARTYPEATFIAVQNGGRDQNSLQPPYLPAPPHPAWRFTLTHFHCFGQREVDLYTRMNQEVDHFYPVGSVRADAYLATRPAPPARTHDLCFISQWRRELVTDEIHPHLRRQWAFFTLVEFLGRYAREANILLAIVSNSYREQEEEAFYRERLGVAFDFLPGRAHGLDSYAGIDRAEVVVASWSTLGVETVAMGKRALLCNFTGDPKRDVPRQGIWSLTEPDYGTFRRRLDAIRAMSDSEYRRLSSEFGDYMMRIDPARPAHRVVREHVLACLDGRGDEWSAAWHAREALDRATREGANDDIRAAATR